MPSIPSIRFILNFHLFNYPLQTYQYANLLKLLYHQSKSSRHTMTASSIFLSISKATKSYKRHLATNERRLPIPIIRSGFHGIYAQLCSILFLTFSCVRGCAVLVFCTPEDFVTRFSHSIPHPSQFSNNKKTVQRIFFAHMYTEHC